MEGGKNAQTGHPVMMVVIVEIVVQGHTFTLR
jgi:hypothetical protein